MVFSLATLGACGAPKPPPLPIPSPAHDELTSDDHDVMSAVLDGVIRPEYHSRVRRGQTGQLGPPAAITAPLLVFDSTIPYCNPETLVRRYTLPGCFDPALSLPDQHLPAAEAVRRRSLFLARNVRPLSIHAALGSDVILVPSTTDASLSEFRLYPLGAQVVVFSAPAYPARREAVIFCHAVGAGLSFVSLARVRDRWSITSRNGVVE